jgi:hypothetical protein
MKFRGLESRCGWSSAIKPKPLLVFILVRQWPPLLPPTRLRARSRYAEADPTLDVGGFDARSKLKILIKLAFGIDVHEDEIPCRGITEVQRPTAL